MCQLVRCQRFQYVDYIVEGFLIRSYGFGDKSFNSLTLSGKKPVQLLTRLLNTRFYCTEQLLHCYVSEQPIKTSVA